MKIAAKVTGIIEMITHILLSVYMFVEAIIHFVGYGLFENMKNGQGTMETLENYTNIVNNSPFKDTITKAATVEAVESAWLGAIAFFIIMMIVMIVGAVFAGIVQKRNSAKAPVATKASSITMGVLAIVFLAPVCGILQLIAGILTKPAAEAK